MRKLIAMTSALILLTSATSALAEDGESKYRGAQPSCGVCHDSGAAGAPVVGKPDTWKDRLEVSVEELTKTVMTGKGAMPAYQGRMSEEDARAAVQWMVDQTRE